MGAWEITNFGNDTAMDWLFDFEGEPTTALILETIDPLFQEEYMDGDVAAEALAALEVVAAAKGRPPTDLPESITPDQLASVASSSPVAKHLRF